MGNIGTGEHGNEGTYRYWLNIGTGEDIGTREHYISSGNIGIGEHRDRGTCTLSSFLFTSWFIVHIVLSVALVTSG